MQSGNTNYKIERNTGGLCSPVRSVLAEACVAGVVLPSNLNYKRILLQLLVTGYWYIVSCVPSQINPGHIALQLSLAHQLHRRAMPSQHRLSLLPWLDLDRSWSTLVLAYSHSVVRTGAVFVVIRELLLPRRVGALRDLAAAEAAPVFTDRPIPAMP